MLGRRTRDQTGHSPYRSPTTYRAARPKSSSTHGGTTTAFELDQERQYKALTTAVAAHVRQQCTTTVGDNKNDNNNNNNKSFRYWGVVTDAWRNYQEAAVRFGGPPPDGAATVLAWGSNDMYTQALPERVEDDDQQVDNFLPHPLGVRVHKVRAVAAGGTSVAALSSDGTAYTWGSSDDGVLGRIMDQTTDASDDAAAIFQATPKPVTEFRDQFGTPMDDVKVQQVTIGAMHTLFLTNKGVFFTGALKDSDSGKFSPPDLHKDQAAVAPPEPPARYRNVVGSDGKPKINRKTGEVEQELVPIDPQEDIYGITGDEKTPILIPDLPNIILIFSGGNFCVAMDADRQLWTFGFGNSGELARSSQMALPDDQGMYDLTTNYYRNKTAYGWFNWRLIRDKYMKPAPAQYDVPCKVRALNVAAGDIHMLVTGVDENGAVRLYSSGHNNYGQLGHGDTKQRHALTPVTFFDKKPFWVGQVAAGNHHSLALTAGGDALFAWGRSDYGQLGLGPEVQKEVGDGRFTPQRVPFPAGKVMQKVVAGEASSAVITMDGELFTWGYEGTTGHKKYLNKDCPYARQVVADDMDDVIGYHSVAMGSQFGLALAHKVPHPAAAPAEEESPPTEPSTKRQRRV